MLDPRPCCSDPPPPPICQIAAGCKNPCASKKNARGHFKGCQACLDRRNSLPCNLKRKGISADEHMTKKQRCLASDKKGKATPEKKVILGRIGSVDTGANTMLVNTRTQGNWELAIHNHNAVVDEFNYLVAAASTFVTKPLSTTPLAVLRPTNKGLDLLHKTPALYQLGISRPITSDASPSTIAKGFLPEGWTEDTELEVQDMSQLPKALVEGTKPPETRNIALGEALTQFDTSAKGYNCLEIPGSPLQNAQDCFMHDVLAYNIGMRHIKKNKTLLKNYTAGTIKGDHEDGSGCLTMLEVDYGLKVWTIFCPDEGSAEHLILRPGDCLTPHSVYTPEPTLCSGQHFLHYDSLKAIYKGAARQAKEPISNEYIPAVGLLLCFMALALADDSFVERLQLGPKLGQYAAELDTMLQSYDLLFPVPPATQKEDTKLYLGIKDAIQYTKDLALKTLVEIKRRVCQSDESIGEFGPSAIDLRPPVPSMYTRLGLLAQIAILETVMAGFAIWLSTPRPRTRIRPLRPCYHRFSIQVVAAFAKW
ncbi:hypothetical protein HD553DRAFT_324434 [Filobasidium floriforme]|uniref:uncharacterized protein n=1 Tax=Filobasidium floriforme TaxID=5210 RepID=UPI001E8CEBFD|nr:uncharacterized protein HD553DRAFT_324434 [Filobasidium floriforme]KAH8083522.1 hypothetical protein HD553DRAFT_324434 [Filobasidium floriforme]